MTYKFVKCPNFSVVVAGVVQTIRCKLCGSVIADTRDVPVGMERTPSGQLVKVVRRQLVRFSSYREIKIAFNHPSYAHVTHGCSKCLHMQLPAAVLAELHAADQEESPDGYTDRERAMTPTRVLVLSKDMGGIV